MLSHLDFTFKPFEKMTPADYAYLGLKSGLEIHQQLKTERKLFCRCPAGRYSTRVDAEILRHMRPTLSELGVYDGTALMEFKTKKEIIYLLNAETVCTYEMDDAPPFEIDPEAVRYALEIALLLKLNLIGELHIARKQYLDGSIPTGFQRTTIFGTEGEIPYGNRKIRIAQLGLEEDACREVTDIGHTITYRTDRLGMPLIEMVTYPDMRTPQEVADVANILRRLVRATGRVRTGAGAAREDVNVSVEGGTRIEIKGVPSIGRIPYLIYNEAMRQHNLLKIREELRRRGITAQTLRYKSAEVTGLLTETSYVPIQQAIAAGAVAHAIKLEGLRGILAHPTQEHTYFAQEISDRIKVIACLMDHPNMLHSDAIEPGISRGQWNRIRKRLASGAEDVIVVVWGSPEDVDTALKETIIRAQEACEGVPSETRQAFRDGTNGFERILPGADRMYPDTDEPPIGIPDRLVEETRAQLPVPPWERLNRLNELKIPPQVAKLLSESRWGVLFDAVLRRANADAKLAACTLVHLLRPWDKLRLPVERLSEDVLVELFAAVQAGRLRKEAVRVILEGLIFDRQRSLAEAMGPYLVKGTETAELDTLIDQAANLQHTLVSRLKSGRMNYLMGFIMIRLRGRIDPAVARARLMNVVVGDDDGSKR
ncbi:MAG: Glu-tRNA(Gln) amidotransferase GatDE subunit E [Myxococcales bacterium]|nr:MAG: Glu-tRNA(Gln) amidotransferase GatDE subunit E [Myxococcales bacterium]